MCTTVYNDNVITIIYTRSGVVAVFVKDFRRSRKSRAHCRSPPHHFTSPPESTKLRNSCICIYIDKISIVGKSVDSSRALFFVFYTLLRPSPSASVYRSTLTQPQYDVTVHAHALFRGRLI